MKNVKNSLYNQVAHLSNENAVFLNLQRITSVHMLKKND